MRVSGFTFIRNGERLGFPFVQSIRSALPLVDEFIVAIGASDDQTEAFIHAIDDPKIKIIKTHWNEHMQTKGFVYGQQKMIAQYCCTGDWALYIEGDELLHEQDYIKLTQTMQRHLHNPNVEALVFDYLHFYGNKNTYVWSPSYYRRAARLIKTSVRSIAPDGLYWVVLDKKNKAGRYPKAALANATMYHYGWVRPEAKMIDKIDSIEKFWGQQNSAAGFGYANIDPTTLHYYTGTHPAALEDFFPEAEAIFPVNQAHQLTKRERKNRLGLKLEKWLQCDFSKKHFTLIEK